MPTPMPPEIGIAFLLYIIINGILAVYLDVGYLSIGNDEDNKEDKDNKDDD